MVINTNRLILRPFKVEDATSFYEITQDKAIKEYVPYASPESVEESQQYIITYYANGDFIHDFYFIIELQSTHEIIGSLIVTQNLEKEFDMSLVISKKHRCNGYMAETIQAFIKSMPSNSHLIFLVNENNQASLNLMKRRQIPETDCNYPGNRKFLYVTH